MDDDHLFALRVDRTCLYTAAFGFKSPSQSRHRRISCDDLRNSKPSQLLHGIVECFQPCCRKTTVLKVQMEAVVMAGHNAVLEPSEAARQQLEVSEPDVHHTAHCHISLSRCRKEVSVCVQRIRSNGHEKTPICRIASGLWILWSLLAARRPAFGSLFDDSRSFTVFRTRPLFRCFQTQAMYLRSADYGHHVCNLSLQRSLRQHHV